MTRPFAALGDHVPTPRSWLDVDRRPLVLREAESALASGQVVAFPTEAGYVLACDAFESRPVQRLLEQSRSGVWVAVRGPAEAADWVPEISPLGRRLARRIWPGPLTIRFANGWTNGLGSRLPNGMLDTLADGTGLGLRAPAHEALQSLLRRRSRPLLCTNAHGPDGSAAIHGAQIMVLPEEPAELIIDAGPTRFGAPASVVRVDDRQWQLIEDGVLSAEVVARLTASVILFVCTGNTCRSPLCEAIARKLLAEKLGCSVEEVYAKGYIVQSAGMAALSGAPASKEAVEAAKSLALDISGHVSQALTPQMLTQADQVFAMTAAHLRALASRYPRQGRTVQLLSPEGKDISDPIGADRSIYEQCADEIFRFLDARIDEIVG